MAAQAGGKWETERNGGAAARIRGYRVWLRRPASPGPAIGNGEPIHNEPDQRHQRARN
jgi:hypothetical protein